MAEFISLIFLFRYLAESAWLSFGFGFIFLTLFSYFLLRLYFQTQKPAQFENLKDIYEKNCKTLLRFEEGNLDKHVALANAYCKLANSLHKKESRTFRLPSMIASRFNTLNVLV